MAGPEQYEPTQDDPSTEGTLGKSLGDLGTGRVHPLEDRETQAILDFLNAGKTETQAEPDFFSQKGLQATLDSERPQE